MNENGEPILAGRCGRMWTRCKEEDSHPCEYAKHHCMIGDKRDSEDRCGLVWKACDKDREPPKSEEHYGFDEQQQVVLQGSFVFQTDGSDKLAYHDVERAAVEALVDILE